MSGLITDLNLGPHGDEIYAALISAHEGLTDAQSARLNVRLVLLLANQVGDREALMQAMAVAREGVTAAPADRSGG